MNAFATFRLVPPPAPQSIAIAILTVAAFVGATDLEPRLWDNRIDPLALALAVQIALVLALNLSQDRLHQLLRHVPFAGAGILTVSVAGLAALVLWGTAALAAKLMIIWVLLNALHLTWADYDDPDQQASAPTPFGRLTSQREEAILLEAAGMVILAATLLSAWIWGGAFAFVLVMAPGRLLLRFFVQWIIVLYLLDAQDRGDSDAR